MNSRNWKLCIIMAIVAALGMTYIAFATESGGAGTAHDPLVTVSYVETRLEAFAKKYGLL